MEYIYLLIWLFFKNIIKADGQRGQLSGKIEGGVEVPIAMYPHVAVIYIDDTRLCGGSIISNRVILTAAHCTVYSDKLQLLGPRSFKVFLGSSYPGQGMPYEVCRVRTHKSYHPDDYFYDIAVLILKKKIKYGPTIQKVKIVQNESWRNAKAYLTIAGFGALSTHGGLADHLMATRMHYVDSKTCNQSQSGFEAIVPDHMFCMIGRKWTSDCFGDSGSGVMWKGLIVGIVSSGRVDYCGSDMIPSLYVNVHYFRKWIRPKLKEAASLKSNTCDHPVEPRSIVRSPFDWNN